jgi:hypothetical protein
MHLATSLAAHLSRVRQPSSSNAADGERLLRLGHERLRLRTAEGLSQSCERTARPSVSPDANAQPWPPG